MEEILVYPLLELLFLLLFCSKMARRRPSLPGIVCASVCAVLYIALLRRITPGLFLTKQQSRASPQRQGIPALYGYSQVSPKGNAGPAAF